MLSIGAKKLAGGIHIYIPYHSGFEHTTDNVICTLEHFAKMADTDENVTPQDNVLHGSIKDAFVGFCKVVKLLYLFLVHMKNQKKRCVNKFISPLNPLLLAWD